MGTLLFFVACGILALVVMSKIPGLEHLVRPIIGLAFDLLKASLENLWAWGIYLFKTLWYSHLDLLKHFILSENAIDPSVRMKREADNA